MRKSRFGEKRKQSGIHRGGAEDAEVSQRILSAFPLRSLRLCGEKASGAIAPRFLAILFLLVLPVSLVRPAETGEVRFTRGTLEVPTYTFERSEAVAPLFKSDESRGLYPYAVLDRETLSRKPVSVKYESLMLENEYLRVTLLPELGGRIWSARDKIANREIFYATSVIKPTVYNQRGGWPAGNLEVYGPYDAHMLTWPGEPWPWASRKHSDGSASILLTHIDHFFRNKVTMEVRLYPGRSFLELSVRLRNNNPLPNRYLLWTNAGIAAGEGTRFVYPMTKTIAHVSSDIGEWPIIDGADLSWYKNNKNMLGVFGLDIYDNFISAYDTKADYGTICFTDRRLARGIKTWTWGTGEAAMRQMQHYTDSDGPYIEVQSGRFVWDGNYELIEPGKSDGWTEYWYGTGGLGELTTATRDVAIAFDSQQKPARLAINATGNFPNAQIRLKAGEATIWSARETLAAGRAYRTQIELKPEAAAQILTLEILSAAGGLLTSHTLRPDGNHPNAVFASDSIPRKFATIDTLSAEEIFQKGLGHEKFGELKEAWAAYEAALAKDRGFSAAHLRLGLLAFDRDQLDEAIGHFRAVLDRDPGGGEAHYFLATAYAELGKTEEARRHYFRLLPSSSKFEQRDYGLGLLALKAGNFNEAESRLAQAAAASPLQLASRQAYAFTLRKLGRTADALKECDAILAIDPTNGFSQSEKNFLHNPQFAIRNPQSELFDRACARHEQGYQELAGEYMKLQAWEEAARILDRGILINKTSGRPLDPMLQYALAYVADRRGEATKAQSAIATARRQKMQLDIFPFRRESIQMLTRILKLEPHDPNAATLLGDLLYARGRREEAEALWRKAIESDPRHFLALRDLGMSLLEAGKATAALPLLSRAAAERPDHLPTTLLVARLNSLAGNAMAAREVIERALQNATGSDRLIETLATIETQAGNHPRALRLLTEHSFEPRHQAYSLLPLYQVLQLMMVAGKEEGTTALDRLRRAQSPPANLGLDDFAALQSARLLVFEALLHQNLGDQKSADQAWQSAARVAIGEMNDDALFRALALRRTNATEAAAWFRNFLIVNEVNKDSDRPAVRATAYYLAGIHAAFDGQMDLARKHFQQCLELDRSNLWAQQALAWMDAGLFR